MAAADDGSNADQPPERVSPFWLKRAFPDAQGIFDTRYRKLSEIKDDCFVALDANVLLLPYNLEAVSLPKVVAAYKLLAEKGRLIIPAHAAREFAKHRSQKIGELVGYLRREAGLSGPVLKKKAGALVGHAAYDAAVELSSEVTAHVKKLQQALNGLADEIASNVGDDPVSNAYRKLFEGAVREGPIDYADEKAFTEELKTRFDEQRPPGYKDARKPDDGAGDLIIWQTVLAEGEDRKADCIFVTGDEKSDWYVQSNGAFQPRLELIEEYRARSGRTLHILPLSQLLKLFEVPAEVIEDVRRIEIDRPDVRPPLRSRRDEKADHLLSLQEQIAAAHGELAALTERIVEMPEFDGNMHLPWNRAHMRLRGEINALYRRLQDLESRYRDAAAV